MIYMSFDKWKQNGIQARSKKITSRRMPIVITTFTYSAWNVLGM